jgi:esterase/lipase superfamily enzyme
MMGPLPVRRLAFIATLAVVAACAGTDGTATFLPTAKDGASVEVLVATSRSANDGPLIFGAERSAALGFAVFNVSVPPDRLAGTVTWPSGPPGDPRADFLVIEARRLQGAGAFAAAVEERVEADQDGVREAIVFAHGYNVTFAEGVYRQAQIAHDFGLPDLPIHFSWPSAGSLRGYVYDKESAIFAAEGLAELMEILAGTSVDQIALAGHSMGGLVVMEALRLLELRDSAAFGKLHAVVLLAPDVDVDIFRQRMALLEGRDLPVYIFASSRDRALRVSSRLQGRRPRLGALTDPVKMADLPVYLIDVSDVESADPYNHSTVAASPLMIALLDGLSEAGIQTFEDVAKGNAGFIETTAHAVDQATRVIVDPLAGP